jgi:hypothetical protein
MSDDESVKIAAFLEQQEMDEFDRTVTPLEYGTQL